MNARASGSFRAQVNRPVTKGDRTVENKSGSIALTTGGTRG